jgi:hypothetical protein
VLTRRSDHVIARGNSVQKKAREGVKKAALKKSSAKTKEKSRSGFKEKISDLRDEVVAEKRKSARTTRKPIEAIIAAKRHFAGPGYTPADNKGAGGKHSWATLGPGCTAGLGSDSQADKPGAIVRARREYNIDFISGHLLNADFDGDGKDSANLTILTSAANGSHKGFDGPVLKAVGILASAYKSLYGLGMDVDALKYGIKVAIDTLEEVWSDDYPGTCISAGLSCSAEVVGRPTGDEILASLPADESLRVAGWAAKLIAAESIMDNVEELVNQANAHRDVDNSEPA